MKTTDQSAMRHTWGRWYRWYPAPENALWALRLPEWFAFVTAFLAVCMFGQGSHRLAAAYAVASTVGWILRTQVYGFVAGFEESRKRAHAESGTAMTPAEVTEMAAGLSVIQGHGYLYVIRFSSGVVKVGQTVDPQRRVVEHRRDAEAYNVAITKLWISPVHRDYLDNEVKLINQCSALWVRARQEYFHAADFDTAVGIAASLTAAVG